MAALSPGNFSEDTEKVQALKTAVSTGNVERVAELLLAHDYSVEIVKHALDSVCGGVHDNTEGRIDNNVCADSFESTADTIRPRIVFWERTGKLLGDSSIVIEKRLLMVEEACARADDVTFVQNILPHCPQNQLDSLLPRLGSRSMWKSVAEVLKRGVSDAQDRHVEEAAQKADDLEFIIHILHRYSDEHLLSMFPQLKSRGLWLSADKVLKRCVSDTQYRQAVEQAAQEACYKDLVCFILPQCSDSEMDTVMTRCLSRGQWESAYLGLNKGDAHFDEYVLDELCKDMPVDFTPGQQMRVRASLYRDAVRETVVKAVEEASRTAEDSYFVRYVLPHCKNQQVNTVLTNLVARDMWRSVRKLLEKRDWEKHFMWAIKESVRKASDEDLDRRFVHLFNFKQLFPLLLAWLAEFERLSVMKWYICLFICKAIDFRFSKINSPFWAIMTTLNIDPTACSAASLFRELMKNRKRFVKTTLGRYCCVRHSTEEECNTFFTTIVAILCCFVFGSGEHASQVAVECDSFEGLPIGLIQLGVLKCVVHETERHLSNVTNHRDLGNAELMIFNAHWSVLTTKLPWTAEVISYILREDTWDILNSTCLWYCGEPTRRHMFQLAVKEKQWKIVKQWADHTLYDDQRWWALDEAYKEKQWDVMLRLADHGLAALELTKVTNRLIRSADWDIFLAMLERGVDIAEIKATLLKTLSENKQKERPSPHSLEKALQQIMKLKDELSSLKFERHGMSALKSRKWLRVFYFAQRSMSIGKSYKLHALKAAIKSKTWHVVIPLIRLGIDTVKHDSLFTGMMKRRQWGVCSALLDLGVSLQVCLDALSQLMEMNQWTLVARVMEFNVGDEVRQQVMQRAMERREGSVVWRCISTMDHYRLSVEERQTMFQQAFSHGDWQTIKPLVEMKDDTGIKHRDIAMLVAIEQHQWDVVDYCQLYGADIDVKGEDGETPLNRANEKRAFDLTHEPHADWEAVEALVVRDADPNILDRYGRSVLNTAIEAYKWELVKLLIEYLGDVHKKAKYKDLDSVTPLQLLIEKRQSEVIQHTLMWCPDLWRGVTWDGETTIHALCVSRSHCENSLYYQVRRGVDPFALTKSGMSVLVYAVRSKNDALKMVKECIKLGFSTHQPRLTNIDTDMEIFLKLLLGTDSFYSWTIFSDFTSPLLCATLMGLSAVVLKLLYESGASSYTELFKVYSVVLDAENCSSQVDERYREDYLSLFNYCKALLPTLEHMATTPRSLMSSCRLLISHCLDPRGRRHRDIGDLDILTPKMKDYVMFTDLTHPDYGKEEKTPQFEHMTKLLAAIEQMEMNENGDNVN